jgi:hypothetical protein
MESLNYNGQLNAELETEITTLLALAEQDVELLLANPYILDLATIGGGTLTLAVAAASLPGAGALMAFSSALGLASGAATVGYGISRLFLELLDAPLSASESTNADLALGISSNPFSIALGAASLVATDTRVFATSVEMGKLASVALDTHAAMKPLLNKQPINHVAAVSAALQAVSIRWDALLGEVSSEHGRTDRATESRAHASADERERQRRARNRIAQAEEERRWHEQERERRAQEERREEQKRDREAREEERRKREIDEMRRNEERVRLEQERQRQAELAAREAEQRRERDYREAAMRAEEARLRAIEQEEASRRFAQATGWHSTGGGTVSPPRTMIEKRASVGFLP